MKNYYVYSEDANYVERLLEEYAFIGRHAKKVQGGIVVFALPPKKVKPKKDAARGGKGKR